MLKPEVIDALVAAGVTAEQLAAALKADHAQEEARRVAKRAKDAERQRRHRLSRVTERDSGVTVRDACDIPPQNIESRATHVGDNLKPLETSGREEKKKRATRIPPDMKPDIEVAIAIGLSRPAAEQQALVFLDYFRAAPGEKGLKVDWDATWRNWCRRHVDDAGAQQRAPPGNGTKPRPLSTAEQAIHELRKYRDPPEPSFRSEADFGTGATFETRDFRRIG